MILRARLWLRSLLLRWFPARVTTKLLGALVAEAEVELLAGVALTQREWRHLSAAEQAARGVAGMRMANSRAALAALAATPAGAVALLRSVGGPALDAQLAGAQDKAALRAILADVAEHVVQKGDQA